MRIYKDSKGLAIVVTNEHLDCAVKIKDELQKASPSMRCNWKTHKKMMIEEGFEDSDYNESYRCLIKDYQAKNGLINTKDKHIDLVAEKKLSSIKNAVGEMAYNKREIQLESQKLGKLKRELTLYGVVAEEISDAVKVYLEDFKFPKILYKPKVETGNNRMVVLISDWHIGAVVEDVQGNSYNYNIAKLRVENYLDKVIKIARENKVSTIDVVCLGDMTEHTSMRKVNQAFETEFTTSQQITKAFELINFFVTGLASNKFNVIYRGISGNHDRMNGDKNDNIDGDSTIFIVNYFMKELINKINSERISRVQYVECDDINYSTTINIGKVNMKFVHGDNERNKEGGILSSHSALDGVVYNLVGMGHIHHHKLSEVGQNRYEMYCGSIMGMNNYAKKAKFSSTASQAVILIDEAGEIDVRRIGLQ